MAFGQDSAVCKIADEINQNNHNYIKICSESNGCEAGLQCLSNICVNLTSVKVEIGRHMIKPPNNIFFSFALWDSQCNPVVLGLSMLRSMLSIFQKRIYDQYYSLPSSSESGSGILPGTIHAKPRVLILLDTSGSVINSWNTTRDATASFIESLGTRTNTSGFVVRIFTFDGRESILPLKLGTKDLTPSFIDVNTPGLASDIRGSVVSSLDPGYDPSTNLYGALQQSGDILHNEPDPSLEESAAYLVLYSDGTERANYVEFSEAMAALKRPPSIYRYCVFEDGEQVSNTLSRLQQICNMGMYFLPGENSCSNSTKTLKDRFIEISTVMAALVSNYGLFLHCASFRKGVFSIQVRFSGSDDSRNSTITADAALFNTTVSACGPHEAAAWRNQNNDIAIIRDDFMVGTCQRQIFFPEIQIHR